MNLLASLCATALLVTSATTTASAARLTPSGGSTEDALVGPWGWLAVPIEVYSEEDADCVYSLYYVSTPSGPYVLWSEVTCADVVPDEEDDW